MKFMKRVEDICIRGTSASFLEGVRDRFFTGEGDADAAATEAIPVTVATAEAEAAVFFALLAEAFPALVAAGSGMGESTFSAFAAFDLAGVRGLLAFFSSADSLAAVAMAASASAASAAVAFLPLLPPADTREDFEDALPEFFAIPKEDSAIAISRLPPSPARL